MDKLFDISGEIPRVFRGPSRAKAVGPDRLRKETFCEYTAFRVCGMPGGEKGPA